MPSDAGEVVLCSVPTGPGRTHGTVYVSHDGGKTWPRKRVVVRTAFAYSSMVNLADDTIGLFYEARGHRNIRLVKFTLEWLLDPEEDAEK